MGAGLSGVIMAYEMKDQMRPEDNLTVVTKDPVYHFVPSNPWVAVGWRTRQAVEVDLAPTFARRGIDFRPVPVAKVDPHANQIELEDGSKLGYDYLIIATGPELAFDEVEGLGPTRRLHVLDLPCRPCAPGVRALRGVLQEVPGRSSRAPCRARPASGRRTSTRSFSIRNCGAGKSAIACR